MRPHIARHASHETIADLELHARTTVEGIRQGLHASPFHGYSAEFSQYRAYRQGDDPKYVDWKVFARSNRLYTRQFRETTNLAGLFVIDTSASMAFPDQGDRVAGGTLAKSTVAVRVAATLATLLVDQGDAVGVLSLSADPVARTLYVRPASGRHHLRACLAHLSRLSARGEGSVAEALNRAARLLDRKSLVIVLSDLYEETDALAALRRLSRAGHDVIVVHVLSRQELTLSGKGATEFEDLETGRTHTVGVQRVRADYEANVHAFLDRVQRACASESMAYLRVIAEEPMAPALRRFLIERRARGIDEPTTHGVTRSG